jgi:hypothetical protein
MTAAVDQSSAVVDQLTICWQLLLTTSLSSHRMHAHAAYDTLYMCQPRCCSSWVSSEI